MESREGAVSLGGFSSCCLRPVLLSLPWPVVPQAMLPPKPVQFQLGLGPCDLPQFADSGESLMWVGVDALKDLGTRL